MRRGATTVALIVLLSACGDAPQGTAVVAVTDGDTFDAVVDGAVEPVRIVGMNAPERGACLADAATEALRSLVVGHPVVLVVDTSDRDRNGRLLRYVEVDGVDAGVAIVEAGLAVVQTVEPDTERRPLLEAAQARAQAADAGLWSDDACGPRPPGAGGLRIAELRLDADGPDDRNLNDEWVLLANDGPGASTVDLHGWTLRDESSSHRYSFPPGTAIAAGATLRVRSGCGTDTPTDLHWCESGSAVWNNGGDTAFLLDPTGNVVASLREG